MYRHLGAPPDPTDDQLAAILREALGPPGSGVATVTEVLPAVRTANPAPMAISASLSLGTPGWLLLAGAAGVGLWALSRKRGR